jgi:glycosyltransferase involved in cell wall biosynthesis
MPVRIFVFGEEPEDRYRSGRTIRALRGWGAVEDLCGLSPKCLAQRFDACGDPVWLIRAGARPVVKEMAVYPPPSKTGYPLCALGAWHSDGGAKSIAPGQIQWATLLAETGGDFDSAAKLDSQLPEVVSAYLEVGSLQRLVTALAEAPTLSAALGTAIVGQGLRVVRYAPLDVSYEPALRVAQVVTSLQRGGAERIALALHHGLNQQGGRSRLISIGRPGRKPFPAPSGTIDLAGKGANRAQRLEAAARAISTFGADLVHVHLLDRSEIAPLARLGVSIVVTVHNARPGWPAGLDALRQGEAALVVACAQAVEAELQAARLPCPIRTVWNGIDFALLERTPARLDAARAIRQRLGIAATDFVLLALANPRPQKRLHLLPAILAATRDELTRRGIGREVRLLVAGEASTINESAAGAEEAVRAEVERLQLGPLVRFLGSVDDIAPVLLAADVLVSSSAYEGLSLAHLEALAAGIPVVATAAGGTAEIGVDNPAISVVPVDSGPPVFALLLAQIAQAALPSGRSRAAVHFSQQRMIERYLDLYPRSIAAARARGPGQGLWLVTNNFSTGGAQSSARRLLLGLFADGIPVRAAVLEEEPANPTPGRRALLAAGVPIRVLPAAGTIEPARAVTLLLEAIDDDPPRAVLFWNALMEYKLLLADRLLDTPVYDVSPGEMYYTSMERYFRRRRPGLPYRAPADYGARLAGIIVKYRAEAEAAAGRLGASVHVIPNGVPLGPAPPFRSPSERLIMGTAARISPQKKLEELVAALRLAHGSLPPYCFRFAGGVERGCAAYADRLRHDAQGLAVEWTGEWTDVAPFLGDLDLFVMISEPAGCPNASLEAMAHGLPVIATDVGGAAEQIVDGVTGRVVPRGDTEALAAALIEAAGDPNRRASWGRAARLRAEASFDQKRMVADYRRVCLRDADP